MSLKGIQLGIVLAVVSTSGSIAWAASSSPTPKPSLVSTALVVKPSPTPVDKITPDVASTLLKEFVKSLKNEVRALEHRQSAEYKDLKASQNARKKEWKAKEDQARHAYNAAHPNGQDRRAYVQDFQNRLKALDQMIKEEKKNREKEQDARVQSLKVNQAERLKEFQSYLSRGERPPENLWPRAGN